MLKKLLVLSMAGFVFSGISSLAQAGEDVYVDLSVLDSLSGSAPVAAPEAASSFSEQPLFPVVKNSRSKATPKAQKTKQNLRKAKPTKVATKSKAVQNPKRNNVDTGFFQAAPAENIKDKTSPAPIVAIKSEVEMEAPRKDSDPLVNPDVVVEDVKVDVLVEDVKVEEVSSPTSVNDVLNIPAKPEIVEPALIKAPAAESAPASQTAPTLPLIPVEPTPVFAEAPLPVAPVVPLLSTPSASVPVADVAEVIKATVASESTSPAAAKEPLNAIVGPVSSQIFFEKDASDLNELNQKRVDAVIKSFADAVNNKIAIYAYNLDDGQDVFKKKRLSLNRAVEIRSYLIQKGYKNFSIKIINISNEKEKENMVELAELK